MQHWSLGLCQWIILTVSTGRSRALCCSCKSTLHPALTSGGSIPPMHPLLPCLSAEFCGKHIDWLTPNAHLPPIGPIALSESCHIFQVIYSFIYIPASFNGNLTKEWSCWLALSPSPSSLSANKIEAIRRAVCNFLPTLLPASSHLFPMLSLPTQHSVQDERPFLKVRPSA